MRECGGFGIIQAKMMMPLTRIVALENWMYYGDF